ncbi:huntingtin isoform X2 [Bacillus rossius redtenbacheri]|uniref:huntingtin isoform X2 n=1 Tax=Bacillus rossius redtenbacheri TaxID=93214 RepID=UPI002FDDDD3C
MANLEKLIKSLENLKVLQLSPHINDESTLRKKDKIAHCLVIADAMCGASVKGTPNFSHLLSITIEMLLQLCDDASSDVRMVADESLNRIIRAMVDNNVVKILVELHKEIKKNGNARSLRAALWRFSELCHMIRPQKGKPYMLNLIPCIMHVAQRPEEPILETLAAAMHKIFRALGKFASDNDVKSVLKVFLQNLSSCSPVVRRTAASSILAVCLHCRKPHIMITYILNILLDCVVPVRETHSASTVVGVLGCLRQILPHVGAAAAGEEEMKGSFGERHRHLESPQAVDRLLQVYELSLHYTAHADHNVVIAALETLHQLLQSPSEDLVSLLLSPRGIGRSRVHVAEGGEKLSHRSLSQMSIYPSQAASDLSSLLDTDVDSGDISVASSVEKWVNESRPGIIFSSSLANRVPGRSETVLDKHGKADAVSEKQEDDEDDDESCNTSVMDEGGGEYSNIKIGLIKDSDDIAMYSPRRPLAETAQSSMQSDETKQGIDDEQQSFYSASMSPTPYQSEVPFAPCDVGSYTDADVPLKHCARHLAVSFLLTGCCGCTIPDRSVRVSVKSSALGCIAGILRLAPGILLVPLDKAKTTGRSSEGAQAVSDVLLYASHSDPQLRALVIVAVANLLKSVMIRSGGNFDSWLGDVKLVSLPQLVQLILKGLGDESSVCCRQTLVAVSLCLPELLESMHSSEVSEILSALPDMVTNSYWLVKVKLASVFSELPYVTIHHVTGDCKFQDNVLNALLLVLLQDEDTRVRHAAAESVVRIVPRLLFPTDHPGRDAATAKAARLTAAYVSPLLEGGAPSSLAPPPSVSSLPHPFDVGRCSRYVAGLDSALSRVVGRLSQLVLSSHSRHLVYGCCEALALLSEQYLTTVYSRAWSCQLAASADMKPNNKRKLSEVSTSKEAVPSAAEGLFATVMSLLAASPISVDLGCQQWLLQVAGSLFSGLAVNHLHQFEILSPSEPNTAPKQLWGMFTDKKLGVLSEQLLVHVARLLCVFVHVLEETAPSVPAPKPSLPSLPTAPSLSPMKRKTKADAADAVRTRGSSPVKSAADREEKLEEKRGVRSTTMGLFANLPHYMKLYDMIKSAYTNYKITLDNASSEKFVCLLQTVLKTLSQLLEVSTLCEVGRIVEEILAYMRLTITVEPSHTIICVQQLLKCLFGTNVTSQSQFINEKSFPAHTGCGASQSADLSGFYGVCFQAPYRQLASCIASSGSRIDKPSNSTWLSYFLKRGERKFSSALKGVNRGTDKTALASYIRLFEPMVIKALKQYTVTSDVQLQCRVLLLLSQLVQLRVNYCLLDSDKIFFGFVLRQFEFLEEGQIPQAEDLIPKIFYFLVHLSYEKHHSKSITGISEMIQLCNGLMASGQPPVSHCIPALVPVVEDVFLVRGTSGSPADLKDLDTQRECLISVMLRLVEYHQVLELLGVVLGESRQGCDWEERWRRWSRQAADALLPLLARGRVRLEQRGAQLALHRLLGAASPCVFRPADPLLRVLFAEPPRPLSRPATERWLGAVLAMLLLLVSQGKEEAVLARLGELGLRAPPPASVFRDDDDPLDAAAALGREPLLPEQVMARFLLRVIGLVSSQVCKGVFSPITSEDCHYLHEQFSCLLLFCIHMFESGSYCRVAKAMMHMVDAKNCDENSAPMDELNMLFLKLATRCPLLAFQWCYLLTLLNYQNQDFWAQVLREPHELILNQRCTEKPMQSPCINLEIVRKGGTILFCDFACDNLGDAEQLSWLLVNHIEEIVLLSTEPPIQELIAAVNRNSAASGLLVQAVGSKCQDLSKPSFVCRMLRCLEGVHPAQSGAVLLLLVPRMLARRQLAPARLAGALACRRAELLLTMGVAEVATQLARQDLRGILVALASTGLASKHNGLMSLLNKLGSQFYDMPPLEGEERNANFNVGSIHSISLDKAWFFAQVKHRCCQKDVSGMDSAQMLSKLDYDEILSVFSCENFNISVLEDCLKLATQLTLQAFQNAPASAAGYADAVSFVAADETLSLLESQLYRASRLSLLQHVTSVVALVPAPHQVYSPIGRDPTCKETKYSDDVNQLFLDSSFWNTLFQVAPAVTCYLDSQRKLSQGVWPGLAQDSWEDLAKFGVICLEAVQWLLSASGQSPSRPALSCHQAGLACADAVLKELNLGAVIGHSAHVSWLASACGAVTATVNFLLAGEKLPVMPPSGLCFSSENPDAVSAAYSCHQMATLVLWLEKTHSKMLGIPRFLAGSLKSLIVTLSRMPVVNSFVATPPEVWQQGWTVELSGLLKTIVPPLPVEYLQDVDLLQQLIFRVTLLGWTSRQQFEETWVSLLSVLSSHQTENMPLEEAGITAQTSGLAVGAITALLVQTLLLPMPGNPNTSRVVHQSRDKPLSHFSCYEELKTIHELLCWKLQDQELMGDGFRLEHVFQRGNLERLNNNTRFGYSQVCLEYLWTGARILGEDGAPGGRMSGTVSGACLEREQCLAASGLDLHSCLHFLLDLYSQWTLLQSRTPLRLLNEAMCSVLSISDLFTERAQFQWMLDTCLELSRSHPPEDEILHQYLVLGACKAAAVLGMDAEVLERVKKLVEGGLKSAFLPSRVASLHGILYLLQGCRAGPGPGLSEETLQIVPLAIEYVQKYIDSSVSAVSEEHQLAMWALVFYLLENVEERTTETELTPVVLQFTLAPATYRLLPLQLRLCLLQGLERLVVSKSVGGKVREQVTKLAVEQLRHSNPRVFLPALQLLLSCMYTGKSERKESSQDGESKREDTDPELLIEAMEKTSVLFDRIKKGYPFEVELICGVLPNLLTDFFPPSEILTKVIGEFLSTQQPHPRLLAGVVFQVFERACQQSQLELLQHWVVLSLSNFTQCSPVGMATWCLTCFFISASTNPWLRAIFPHVQSRIGRCESEDRKLLCISAADFYNQLTDEAQKKTFVSTLEAAAGQSQHLFSDLIACL